MTVALRVEEPSARYVVSAQPAWLAAFDLLATPQGGIGRLRRLILELAVQGKLVSQSTQDEHASAIVASARAAKGLSDSRQSAAENGATGTPAPPLPSGWCWSSLSEIGLISPRNQAHDNAIASFVQMSSVPVAMMQPHLTEPRPWREIKTGFTHFAEGDVGVAKITPCFENGKSTVFRRLHGGIGAGTTELHIVRPLGGVLAEYVLVFLKSPAFLRNGEAAMTGTAGQKRLPRSCFEGTPFALPPIAEQHRIVARVEELMKLCDALEQNGRLADEQHARLTSTLFNALASSESAHALAENWQRVAEHFDLLLDRSEALDALEQTILQLAVCGLLAVQDESDEPATGFLERLRGARPASAGGVELPNGPYEIPKSWAWCAIEQIANVGTGTTPSRTNAAYFDPPEVPWVNSGETARPFIASTAQHVSGLALRETSLKVYPQGTLVVAMYGQGKTRGQISELLIAATTNQACAAIVPVDSTVHHRRYLKLVFEKSYDELREGAAGGAQPNLNVGKIKSTLIPLPPLAEQRRIVARVEELRRLCANLRRLLTEAREIQSRLADALVAELA